MSWVSGVRSITIPTTGSGVHEVVLLSPPDTEMDKFHIELVGSPSGSVGVLFFELWQGERLLGKSRAIVNENVINFDRISGPLDYITPVVLRAIYDNMGGTGFWSGFKEVIFGARFKE